MLSSEGVSCPGSSSWIAVASKGGLAVRQQTVRTAGLQVGRPTRLNAEEAEELEAQWRDFGAPDQPRLCTAA